LAALHKPLRARRGRSDPAPRRARGSPETRDPARGVRRTWTHLTNPELSRNPEAGCPDAHCARLDVCGALLQPPHVGHTRQRAES
jgi:hypothetical protein